MKLATLTPNLDRAVSKTTSNNADHEAPQIHNAMMAVSPSRAGSRDNRLPDQVFAIVVVLAMAGLIVSAYSVRMLLDRTGRPVTLPVALALVGWVLIAAASLFLITSK